MMSVATYTERRWDFQREVVVELSIFGKFSEKGEMFS